MPPTLVPDLNALTRHAVIVGQTGSGKTGALIGLVEDLLLRRIPVISLDPKGDLGNLGLVFPNLAASDFLPWMDPAEAQRKGVPVEQLAMDTASAWRAGLAKEGIDDLGEWSSKVAVDIYTPGSDGLRPIDVVSALTQAPLVHGEPLETEALREHVGGVVRALLGLVGRSADLLRDAEAILLCKLIGDAFAAGEDMPLEALLPAIVEPRLDRIGMFPTDEVIPPKARSALALDLNDVVASDAFAAWRTGAALDVASWLRPCADGRTPATVLTLSHLDDALRMFFVTLVLQSIVTWTRQQPGTSALRGVLVLDEAFGFLPPHPRDPTSKAPLLTLLKQARAVGLGVVIATQNPMDLDYKALSNCGTWIIGRLVTENDRRRVLEGVQGTGVAMAKNDLPVRIGQIPTRTFVIRDPSGALRQVVSRWTRVWLRGPLTRPELKRLLAARADAGVRSPIDRLPVPPPVPQGCEVRWLNRSAADGVDLPPRGDAWQPALYARVQVRFDDGGEVCDRTLHRLWSPLALDVPPRSVPLPAHALAREPGAGDHLLLPGWLDEAAELERLRDGVHDQVRRSAVARRWRHGEGQSRLGEDPQAFAGRVGVEVSALEAEEVRAEAGDVEVVFFGVVWV